MSKRASIETLRATAHPYRGSPRSLLRVSDLDRGQLAFLLRLAAEMRSMPTHWRHLDGRGVALLFEEPAIRSRVSFEVALTRLGAHPIWLRRRGDLAEVSAIEDTGRTLGGMCDAIVARVDVHDHIERLAAVAGVPVVNARSAAHHPCQVLADLLTLQDLFGSLEGLKLAFVGDARGVAASLLEAAGPAGMHVAVSAPPGCSPESEVLAQAVESARLGGGHAAVCEDAWLAVEDADVVYTAPWSTGDDDAQSERAGELAPYRVTPALMQRASEDAVFMHSLPARRGREVDTAVIDGIQSVTWVQAANRVPVQQAVLWTLITDQLPSSGVI